MNVAPVRVALLIVGLAITLVSCGKSPPASGVVLERQHVPARDWMDHSPNYIRHCVSVPYTYMTGSGSTRSIRMGTRQSCTSILVGFSDIPRHESNKDKSHTGWRDVTAEEYSRYGVGGHYPNGW